MMAFKGYLIVFEPMWPWKNLSLQIPNALKYFTVPKNEKFRAVKIFSTSQNWFHNGWRVKFSLSACLENSWIFGLESFRIFSHDLKFESWNISILEFWNYFRGSDCTFFLNGGYYNLNRGTLCSSCVKLSNTVRLTVVYCGLLGGVQVSSGDPSLENYKLFPKRSLSEPEPINLNHKTKETSSLDPDHERSNLIIPEVT